GEGWGEGAANETPFSIWPQASLALVSAAAYSFYIFRVGGDFMFARMLIPATPFFLLVLDYALLGLRRIISALDATPVAPAPASSGGPLGKPSFVEKWTPDNTPFKRRAAVRRFACGSLVLNLATLALIGGMAATRRPVGTDYRNTYGIADERAYHNEEFIRNLDLQAAMWRKFFHDLPVCVAFFGSQARVVYKADIARAIESRAGLTDRTIAHLPTPSPRGRVGHEKIAPVPYLVSRRAHFIFSRAVRDLPLDHYIPRVLIQLDEGFVGRVLHWDPELMQLLRQRGAKFSDFPTEELDQTIVRLDELSQGELSRVYFKYRNFYFHFVKDPEREQAFLTRLREVPPLPEELRQAAAPTSD
ncbi:MAG: hypothetical protein ACRD21_16340, partial [Vicinamibacteria bacterium]